MIPAVPSQLLLLAIVYALLAFLLLVLCLGTRWRWSLKVALVLVVSGFYMLLLAVAARHVRLAGRRRAASQVHPAGGGVR